jgi:hypothetical protein
VPGPASGIPAKSASEHGASAHGPECPCPRCTGFRPGHQLSVKHGAKSVVGIRGRAAEVAQALTELMQAEGIYRPAFAPTVQACATVLVRLERAAVAIDTVDDALLEASPLAGYLSAGDRPEALMRLRQDMRSWAGTARAYLNDLGLSPAALARVQRDTGIGKATRAQVAMRELNAHIERHYGEIEA